MIDIDALDYSKGNGLVTVVVQDARTAQVLMVAHADREALRKSIETGDMHFRSRSRGLWRKGGTSGNVMRVMSLSQDCDADAVLAVVEPAGPACHTGRESCFSADSPRSELQRLDSVIASRVAAAEQGSYTRRLLDDRNLRLKKLGEEASELAVACADGDRGRAVAEAADLVYHVMVALRAVGARWDDVERELQSRARAVLNPAETNSVL